MDMAVNSDFIPVLSHYVQYICSAVI